MPFLFPFCKRCWLTLLYGSLSSLTATVALRKFPAMDQGEKGIHFIPWNTESYRRFEETGR